MIRKVIGLLPQGFAAFLVVGGVGFVVDAAVLALLVHSYGWGPYSSRLVSFAAAVTVTWALNRTFVFSAGRTTSRRREYSRYLLVQAVGMVINFGVYSLCIASSPVMNRWPVLALAVGSAAALIWNYAGARWFVFTGQTDSDLRAE